MTIQVEDRSGVYMFTEDGEFKCQHKNVIVEPPCCNGADCGCQGLAEIFCPDCNSYDLSDDDIEYILQNLNDCED